MLFTSLQKTKRNNVKNTLLFFVIPAIILYRKVAGLIMQGLKKFWQNWQWVLPVGALLLSAFTWYYKTSTEIPARVLNCEKNLEEHIVSSNERFKSIEQNQHNIDITLTKLEAMMTTANTDLTIIKNYITTEAHKL